MCLGYLYGHRTFLSVCLLWLQLQTRSEVASDVNNHPQCRGRQMWPRYSWLLGRAWFAEVRVSGVLKLNGTYLPSIDDLDRGRREFLIMATFTPTHPQSVYAWLAAKEPSGFKGAKSSCCLRLSPPGGCEAASRHDLIYHLLRFLLRIAFAASTPMQDLIFIAIRSWEGPRSCPSPRSTRLNI